MKIKIELEFLEDTDPEESLHEIRQRLLGLAGLKSFIDQTIMSKDLCVDCADDKCGVCHD